MAVLVPHYVIGMAMVAGLYGFFMLVQGFMKTFDKMPTGLQWTYFLAVHSYSFRTFMHNEFDEFDELDSIEFPTGHHVLEFYNISGVVPADDLGYLVCYFCIVFLMTMAAMLIKYRSKVPKLTQGSSVGPT
jgi:hypothetical protein